MRCGCHCSLLAKVKQQRALQVDFLKSGWPIFCWKSSAKGRLIRRASHAVVCTLQALVVIPMATKDFAGFMSHAGPGRDCRQTFVSGILHRRA
jgi:hypothetical protein